MLQIQIQENDIQLLGIELANSRFHGRYPPERITGAQNLLQNPAECLVGIDEQYVFFMVAV